MIRRLLFTIDQKPCPFGCKYCFASFVSYRRPPTLAEVRSDSRLLEGVDVIYPACDVDLFARCDALQILSQAADLNRSISISTKASLSGTTIAELAEVNETMRERHCLLKISVSLPARDHIPLLEPRTASYEDRLDALKALATAGILTSVNLKPLMLDVPTDEYVQILTDVAPFVKHVLLGDEYLDPTAPRQMRSMHQVVYRTVSWAEGDPSWPAIPAEQHRRALYAKAGAIGLRCWESDIEFMSYAMAEYDCLAEPCMSLEGH